MTGIRQNPTSPQGRADCILWRSRIQRNHSHQLFREEWCAKMSPGREPVSWNSGLHSKELADILSQRGVYARRHRCWSNGHKRTRLAFHLEKIERIRTRPSRDRLYPRRGPKSPGAGNHFPYRIRYIVDIPSQGTLYSQCTKLLEETRVHIC